MLKIEPRRLPFYSLLKVRSKNVRRVAPVGDSSYFDGLMLMSASAFLSVLGEAGDANPPLLISMAAGGPLPSESELYIVWLLDLFMSEPDVFAAV